MNDHKLTATKWTQAQYDYALKQLWAELTDIPMNPDTERMEAQFLHFPAGTEREDIWHWFDERYSKGIVSLLYSESGETDNCISPTERPDGLNEIYNIPVVRGIRWASFFLLGTLGRYGIKSDARAILRTNSGITFDAAQR